MTKNLKNSEAVNKVTNTKLIKFIITPIGAYGLSYFSGDVAAIESELADKIVENEHAEYVSESEVVVNDTELVVNADEISPEGAEAI